MRIIPIFLIALGLSSCSEGEIKIASSYCAAVAVNGREESVELIGLLDKFAVVHQLKNDKSHPLSPLYFNIDNTLEISVALSMGEFGAVVNVFSRSPAENSEYILELQGYMDTVVSARFPTTVCSEIKGFKNPELYGWSKRKITHNKKLQSDVKDARLN